MGNPLVIGVDLGGTKIASALVDRNGEVLAAHHVATNVAGGTRDVLDRIAAEVNALAVHDATILGVGIGSPGLVNADAGTVNGAVNLGWDHVELAREVQQRLNRQMPVFIEKDTNAGVLGERQFGAGRGCSDLVLLAIGTGFGAGLISGGRLITGAFWAASDLGHLSLDPNGRACVCGARGCLETSLSGAGLLAIARELNATGRYPTRLGASADFNTQIILGAARDGDELAVAVIEEMARVLAEAMAICTIMLDPQRIILGGGLGNASADLLLPRAKKLIDRHMSPQRKKPELVPSSVQSTAVGAAAIVLAHAAI